MDPGIGSASRVRHGPAAEEALQHPLELGLNGATGSLALPADKAGSVVMQYGKESPAHRPGNLASSHPPGKLRNCLSRLTKAPLFGYNFPPFTIPQPASAARLSLPVTNDGPLRSALHQLAQGLPLDRDATTAAFAVLMCGGASPAQTAGLLMGLRARGETAEEVAGAALALRGSMVRLETDNPELLVDTCGTGGGRVGTLNISTAAAFIVAGAGVQVAKHGNRSFTSKSGSADVLEALGIDIALAPEAAAKALRLVGFTFLFAPTYHPAMRHVGPVRKELGVTTIMNLLGPLVNPAGVVRQVVGVADETRAPLMADALAALGARHALVLHAEVGMDEISPSGLTSVWEVEDGRVRTWQLRPERYGLECGDLDDLAGGEPAENAGLIERLLSGEANEAVRCAALLNAAAALYVSGNGWSLDEAAARAQESLSSGAGAAVLARLRSAAPRSMS
jgi:anthranilate phosphoribosyltransferase